MNLRSGRTLTIQSVQTIQKEKKTHNKSNTDSKSESKDLKESKDVKSPAKNQMKTVTKSKSKSKPKTLGIKKWFEYAKKNDLLITMNQLAQMPPKKKEFLTVYALDHEILRREGVMDGKSYRPIDFFKQKEFWYGIGLIKKDSWVGRSGKTYQNLYVELKKACSSTEYDSPDQVDLEQFDVNDRRVQNDREKDGSFGYVQWDDGDDAFTRYMTREQLIQMPNIRADQSWPKR